MCQESTYKETTTVDAPYHRRCVVLRHCGDAFEILSVLSSLISMIVNPVALIYVSLSSIMSSQLNGNATIVNAKVN